MNKTRMSTKCLFIVISSLVVMLSRSARADTPTPDEVAPWYRDGVGWALTGGGFVASGAGAWLLVDAQAIESDANTEPTQSIREQLRDRASSRRVAGAVFGVVGLGSLVVGIVKLALHDNAERARTTALDINVTGDGFVVTGRF